MQDKLIEFKEKLEESNDFKNIFASASNLDEIIELAKENGYDLSLEDITNDNELSDYLLDAVAGGDYVNNYEIVGDNNFIFEENDPEKAKELGKKMVEELHKRGIYGKK